MAEIVADRYYKPYVDRQHAEIAKAQRLDIAIPITFGFANVAGLSAEAIERLTRARPASIAQAARIPGITPAAISALIVAVTRRAA